MRSRRLPFSVSVVALAALVATFSSKAVLAAPGCKSLSATGVSFGTYDPFSTTTRTGLGAISFNCPPPMPDPQVSISAGGSGTFYPRGMSNPSDPILLNYNLYLDAACTQVWGDGTGGTSVAAATPGSKSPLNAYGCIPPLQDVAVGTFSDTVIITFNF